MQQLPRCTKYNQIMSSHTHNQERSSDKDDDEA